MTISADHIARARLVRIEDELLVRRGYALARTREGLEGPCPNCGGRDRFSVHVGKQQWNCRGCKVEAGVSGDVIGLVQLIDNCDFIAAVETLADETGERKLITAPEPVDKKADPKRIELAQWLWLRRVPIAPGTPPYLYLCKRLKLATLDYIPATLGFLTGSDKHPPSMIAAFSLADEKEPGVLHAPRHITAVHLTRLTREGEKAPDERGRVKIMVGDTQDWPIVLAPPNDLLGTAMTEGIEDGFSVHLATGLGVWVAGAAGRMPKLAALFPGYIDCVTTYAHRDQAGRNSAIAAAKSLKARNIQAFIEGLS